MNSFHDKIIWITGASEGIGRELAIQLNKDGAVVILSARRGQALKETQELLDHPEKSLLLTLDMEKAGDFTSAVQRVINQYGRIDLLINNAGISQRSMARETDEEVDRRLMEINYFGTMLLSKAVLPVMRKQKCGTIVAMSSLAGKFGFYLRSSYAASKHALHGFFETLALEEEGNNISIKIFCPAGVRTNISQNALSGNGKIFGQKSELQEKGISTAQAVKQIIKGLKNSNQEIFIGTTKEKLSLKIKVLFPTLFWKLLKARKPSDIDE